MTTWSQFRTENLSTSTGTLFSDDPKKYNIDPSIQIATEVMDIFRRANEAQDIHLLQSKAVTILDYPKPATVKELCSSASWVLVNGSRQFVRLTWDP